MRNRPRGSAIALALLLPGIGFASGTRASDEGEAAKPGTPCTTEVRALLSVTADIPPRITWDPPCAVGSLLVEDDWSSHDVWILETPGTSRIESGVVYGQVPEGASEREPAAPLEPGTNYAVVLGIWREGEPDRVRLVANAPFKAGEGGPRSPVPGPDCPDGVQITVVSGPAPLFTWEPACRVHQVGVDRSDGQTLWVVAAPTEKGIAPSVAYGVVPEGAKETRSQPLVLGETYHVWIRRNQPDLRHMRMRGSVLVGKQTFVH